MNKSTLEIIILIASICFIHVRSDLCLRYNGTQCLECIANYHPIGAICTENLVQIQPKNGNGVIQLPSVANPSGKTVNLVQIKQSLTNKIIPNGVEIKQPINTAVNEDAAAHGSEASSNLQNFVKIAPYDPERGAEMKNKQPISLTDIQKYSVGSPYIQGIFANFSRQILQYELNKISLQLFEFSRQSTFDYTFDPLLQQVLNQIQQHYGSRLTNFTLQAAYFRYLSFAKLYKIFYADLTSIRSIQIDQVDAVVDLFHMQIFISNYSVYDRITVNESTIESIRESTRRS